MATAQSLAALTLHDLSVVVHVHSTHSDGTATVPEIAAAAAATGAGAVLITDHDAVAPGEGYHGGVLVLSGLEVSPKHAGHYLAFGVAEPIDHEHLDPAGIARAVTAAGGAGFAAHPFARGRFGPAGWPALDDEATLGVELWNIASDVVGPSARRWTSRASWCAPTAFSRKGRRPPTSRAGTACVPRAACRPSAASTPISSGCGSAGGSSPPCPTAAGSAGCAPTCC